MTNLELLEILGGVRGKYIQEAQQLRQGERKPVRRRYLRQLAAAIVLVLMLAAFLTTAPGAAAVEYVKETVTSLIEALFPPKEMTILVEGEAEEGSYAADGIEPDPGPGFAVYYDVENYTMVKEGDVTYVRPLPVEGVEPGGLPACEMEIVHLDAGFDQAFSQEQAALDGHWEIRDSLVEPERASMVLRAGNQWDSLCEDRYYVSDGQGGCFRVVCRYFLEAAEGHGVRFAAMARSFAVVAPGESPRQMAPETGPGGDNLPQ